MVVDREKEGEYKMGRYTGPACRICRREGVKLFLKGKRCNTAKCAIEKQRPSPGMHGRKHGKVSTRAISSYKSQLRAKQQLRYYYGLQEEQFRYIFEKALKKRGMTGESMLQLLETRLDNVVYRLGFAPSRRAARQIVLHEHVLVNGKKVNIPSITLHPGSTVQIRDNERSSALVKKIREDGVIQTVPPWLSLNEENLSGVVIRLPTREEIGPITNEQLVVELYSK